MKWSIIRNWFCFTLRRKPTRLTLILNSGDQAGGNWLGCIQGHAVKQEYPAGRTQLLNNTIILEPRNGSPQAGRTQLLGNTMTSETDSLAGTDLGLLSGGNRPGWPWYWRIRGQAGGNRMGESVWPEVGNLSLRRAREWCTALQLQWIGEQMWHLEGGHYGRGAPDPVANKGLQIYAGECHVIETKIVVRTEA